MLDRPIPEPDADDAGWWEALQSGALTVAECGTCRHRWARPLPACPRCASHDVALAPCDGTGTVYSWVTIHRALDPAFEDDVPYTVVVVDLDGGGRVNGRLLGDDPVDETTRVAFEPWPSAGWNLVGFRPAGQDRA